MKLLLVAWYFPPVNTIAAIRLGKLAKYFADQGHDIRVIAAADLPFQRTLPLGIPEDRVQYTKWIDVDAPPEQLVHLLRRLRPATGSSAASGDGRPSTRPPATVEGGRIKSLRSALGSAYRHLFALPDRQIGWLPYAVGAGTRLIGTWRPDVIFASGPPFTTLLIGQCLSRRTGVPWVAELRDRWSDDPYYPPPAWRHALDRALERWVLRSASALVTVSEPWAATYRETYGKSTAVVYNGFDNEDLNSARTAPSSDKETLNIVYTGSIYAGYRDPSPLFQAISLLSADTRRVYLDFYGTNPSHVLPLAEKFGVTDRIAVHPEVTHAEALRLQGESDVVLLMQWNDARDQGHIPAKLFEYLGVQRPILLLGLEDGVPATILREREAGVCANDPNVIAGLLRQWIETKQRQGQIPDLPDAVKTGFSRTEQFRKLDQFLTGLVHPCRAACPRARSDQTESI